MDEIKFSGEFQFFVFQLVAKTVESLPLLCLMLIHTQPKIQIYFIYNMVKICFVGFMFFVFSVLRSMFWSSTFGPLYQLGQKFAKMTNNCHSKQCTFVI